MFLFSNLLIFLTFSQQQSFVIAVSNKMTHFYFFLLFSVVMQLHQQYLYYLILFFYLRTPIQCPLKHRWQVTEYIYSITVPKYRYLYSIPIKCHFILLLYSILEINIETLYFLLHCTHLTSLVLSHFRSKYTKCSVIFPFAFGSFKEEWCLLSNNMKRDYCIRILFFLSNHIKRLTTHSDFFC